MQVLARHHHGGADVILRLDFVGRHEVVAELELPVPLVSGLADAQVLGRDALAVHVDDVALAAVHKLHVDVGLPILSPGRLVAMLHQKHDAADHGWDCVHPLVVLGGVPWRRCQQLHQGPQRLLLAQKRGLLAEGVLVDPLLEPVRVVSLEDHVRVRQVRPHVTNADSAEGNHITEQLGDLGLPAAGHGGRLVAVRGLCDGAHDVPSLLVQVLLQGDLVAGGVDIHRVGHEHHFAARPAHPPGLDARDGVLGDVDDVGELPVDRATLRPHLHAVPEQGHRLLERVRIVLGHPADVVVVRAVDAVVRRKVAAPTDTRPSESPTGVLLLAAKEVGGKAELRLHLLLAVAKVVVRQERDKEPLPGPDADLEGPAVVVALVGRLPCHAVTALALVRLIPMRKTQVLLLQQLEVRRQDDASGVAAPVLHIERRIVPWEARVPGIAEDGLHKVHVGDHGARRHQPDLHALLLAEAGHLRADHGAQQHFDPSPPRLILICCVGHLERRGGWVEGGIQEPAVCDQGHHLLVVRRREPAFSDVEDTLRRALVIERVVENPVLASPRLDEVVRKAVAVAGQGHGAGHAIPVQGNHAGQLHICAAADIRKVLREEPLDAEVHGGQAMLLRRLGKLLLDHLGEALLHLHAGGAIQLGQPRRSWPRTKERHGLRRPGNC
mmetsp:Transcript_106635/g.318737  ORF Transcript_106635/g.318737 Transcript_106635/m.318737 type:complete len:666 (+) Transcript_106635:1540-3537(+)